MKIEVRKIGLNKLKEVIISDMGAQINCGVLSPPECRELAITFEEAADELLSGYTMEELCQ